MNKKNALSILIVFILFTGAYIAWNIYGKAPTSTTPNGFSFVLPKGWSVGAWENTTYPGKQAARLMNSENVAVGGIHCPSLGRYESYGTVPHSNVERSFVKDGITYRVSYSTNANERDTERVVEAGIYATPQDITWEESINKSPKFANTCFVSVEADSIDASILRDLESIYKSWK
ncbi:MAG: hypothetical protein WAV21_03375 [Minisyncoccia bacterium]